MIDTPLKLVNAIDKLRTILDETQPYLLEQDYRHCVEAHQHYVELFKSGGFIDSRVHMEWDKFNSRYGASSIRGFTGEILTTAILNKHANKTAFRLNLGDKHCDLQGADLLDSEERAIQVKTVKTLKSSVTAYDDWFGYSSKHVDFISLVCISQRSCLTMKYLNFLRVCGMGRYFKLKRYQDQILKLND